ncbi:T9SS type A sorting domain-containing protein [Brumimicrobium aurantiacum]|uniref:T9SS type A sorting domain-containing protein n=1 Tax=Brumimicrobium aurantiacum TaxID=1737063 RepID=UPI00140236CB|nr:T9SS type A sorting domain-containing protein [Brumimicrobium aurantiacum]
MKQTDYDGRSTHSKIKSIQNNHDVGTYLYPNPAHDIITLSLGEEELKINAFKLIDVSGKDQSQRVHLVSFHENEITFDLTLLPQGVYYFKYNQFVKKLIKL